MIAVGNLAKEAGPLTGGECVWKETSAKPPLNVWLVDDNPAVSNLLARLLADQGGLICSRLFSSPQALLATLEEQRGPEVILLDIQMDQCCGLDFIQPIKLLARLTHVIMLTTCFDSDFQSRAQSLGASDFLLKSYPLDHLADRIRRATAVPPPVVLTRCGAEAGAAKPLSDRFDRRRVPRTGSGFWGVAAGRVLRTAFFVRGLFLTFYRM